MGRRMLLGEFADRCRFGVVPPIAHASSSPLRVAALPMPPTASPKPSTRHASAVGRVLTGKIAHDLARARRLHLRPKKARHDMGLPIARGFYDRRRRKVSGTVSATKIAAEECTVVYEDAVFVFLRSQGQWLQTQTITGSIFASRFNMMPLGRPNSRSATSDVNNFIGAVHIYSQIGAGTYAFDSTLTTSDPTASPGWLLGFSPIASGNTVTAAAPGGQRIHVFARANGLWTEQAELNMPTLPLYGCSGDRVLVAPERCCRAAGKGGRI